MRERDGLLRARAGTLVAALVALSGCSLHDPDAALRQVDMAARALWPVAVSSDCEAWPLCSELPAGQVLEASARNRDVLELRDLTATGFVLVGREPGESRLTVRAEVALEGERTEAVRVRAWAPTGLWLSARCTGIGHRDPVLLPPLTEVRFSWQLEAEGVGDLPGYAPFEAGALEEVSLDVTGRTITWRTPAETGPIEIRSSALEGFVRTLEVYDEARVDGLDLTTWPARPIEVGRSRRFDAVPLVGAIDTCMDGFERQIEVTTPEVCSLSRELEAWSASTREASFEVWGRAPGLCAVAVALVGTEVSATLEVRVVVTD